MTHDPTTMIAYANIASALILGFAVLMAWFQLRATKRAAELTVLMNLGQGFNSQYYRDGLKFVREELPALLKDPSFLEELHGETRQMDRVQKLADFLNEWEHVAAYVELRVLPEDTVMLAYCDVFRRAWAHTAPAIVELRQSWGPSAYERFENVSKRADYWRKQHTPALDEPHSDVGDSLTPAV